MHWFTGASGIITEDNGLIKFGGSHIKTYLLSEEKYKLDFPKITKPTKKGQKENQIPTISLLGDLEEDQNIQS